ncbi:MAG: TolC family protein [Desulfoprunum sp.]|jgi:outer membrane protein TolC|uniref:TolC family protein n=1 Tax=Desulfoprunum sp. TaxID=2020866 RepID=UPI003C7794BA
MILKIRNVFLSFLLLPVCWQAGSAAAAQPPAADLERLVAEALASNPEIKASEERWQMTVSRAAQAGSLDDPMLMFKIQNGLVRDPFDFNRDATTSKVIGLSQAVPAYGKRALLRKGAEREAEADRWRIEERRIELRRMVKETWYRISLVDRFLEILEKNITALDDLLRFSETMYGVGQGLQQDVLKAQLERSRMEEMRISLQQRRRTLTASMNTLLYRPAETALPAIPPTDIVPLQLEQTALETLAESHRPALKALSAQIEKAQLNRQLADKEFFPDYTLSFEYMQIDAGPMSEGDDMYSAAVSFNLPVQRQRRHAMVAEAVAENRMLVEERNVLRNQIRLAVADTLAALDGKGRLTDLYKEGILLQAASVLEATIASYRAGKTDFMKVLDSRMALFNLEREYHEAVAEYQMQLAVLEGVVGVPLPGYGQ